MPRRFPRAIAVGGLLLPVGILAFERIVDTLGIAVAYKAKMLCSGVFVSKRNSSDVLREIEYDDLAPLRHIRTYVDNSDARVRASIGFVERWAARKRDGGCGLVPRSTPLWRFQWESIGDALSGPPVARDTLPYEPRNALAPVLDAAFAEPDSTRLRRTQAVVVMRNGRVVAERYAPGLDRETKLLGWSVTKSVTNALVGILVRDGKLSLDQPAPIPQWHGRGDPRSDITVRHLLHMSSGLRLNEVMNSLRSDVIRMLLATDDMAAFSTSRKLQAEPGTRWAYASGTSVILARVIRNVIGNDTTYVRFPRDALFDRIGMTSAVIETDAAGTFVGSSLMYATARDWARFGQLYLDDGVWNGERVLPEGWVEFSRAPAPADTTASFGAHFWLGNLSQADSVRLPAGTFHAAGHEGQFITIVPSHRVVIVRLGRTRLPDAWNHDAFVRDVIGALEASSAGVRSGADLSR